MNSKEIKKALIEKIKQDYGIETPFGKISIEQRNVIGEGGNGVVYKATLGDFLMADYGGFRNSII